MFDVGLGSDVMLIRKLGKMKKEINKINSPKVNVINEFEDAYNCQCRKRYYSDNVWNCRRLHKPDKNKASAVLVWLISHCSDEDTCPFP